MLEIYLLIVNLDEQVTGVVGCDGGVMVAFFVLLVGEFFWHDGDEGESRLVQYGDDGNVGAATTRQ